MTCRQRKVCFTEERLIVRYNVPVLAPTRFLWNLALFTLLFSLLLSLLLLSSSSRVYVCVSVSVYIP